MNHNEELKNEETILDPETARIPENAKNETKESKKKGGKYATAVAAGVGAAIGVGATLGGEAVIGSTVEDENLDIAEEQELETTTEPATAGNFMDQEIPIAHVNDGMSFNEAFAAARQEVGPGGVFEWHGSVYGTYYASEWNAMSDEQHDEWFASVDYETVHEDAIAYHQEHNDYQTATIGDEVLVPEEAPADVPEDHAASTGNDTPADIPIAHVSDNMSFNEAFAAARQEVGPGGVFEWHGSVYGTYYASEWNAMSEEQHNEWHSSVDYQAVHEDNLAYHQDNGNMGNEAIESTDVSVPEVEIIAAGSIEIDENQTIDVALDSNGVFYIDVDQDGNIDAIAADLDGDGELDDNEIIDVSEEQSDYEDDLSMNDDYMNDADVSDFDA